MALPPAMTRVAVVGTTGSGKTTVARRLSKRLGLSHVELDALHWEADWTPAPREVLRRRVAEALTGDSWVVDGNYGAVRDLIWPRATTLVWLDYPLRVVMWQLFRRTLRRTVTGAELWNGNRDRFTTQFFSRESLFVWALKTYWRRQRELPELLARPEHAHLRLVRLVSPGAARRWLRTIP